MSSSFLPTMRNFFWGGLVWTLGVNVRGAERATRTGQAGRGTLYIGYSAGVNTISSRFMNSPFWFAGSVPVKASVWLPASPAAVTYVNEY